MESESTDRRWLDAAARLATAALGSTGASPAVGALVVDSARQVVIGRAATPPRGNEQAELLALIEAGERARGQTLYVTLEPAAHFGLHAPSTDTIAASGVGRLVTGALDPDPQRAGAGLHALAEGGIAAVHVPHEPSALLNEGYASRVARGRPFVTLKITVSADGMVGHVGRGQPLPIGIEAQRFVERERAAADAILSGAARAEIEDNDLSIHLNGYADRGPLRVLLAGPRPIDQETDMLSRIGGATVLVVTTPEHPLTLRKGINVVQVDGRRGHPDLKRVLGLLAEGSINRVLVEAGARMAESFIAHELVDRIQVIESAVTVGRLGVPAALLGRFAERIAAVKFTEVDQRALGEDKVRTFQRR